MGDEQLVDRLVKRRKFVVLVPVDVADLDGEWRLAEVMDAQGQRSTYLIRKGRAK